MIEEVVLKITINQIDLEMANGNYFLVDMKTICRLLTFKGFFLSSQILFLKIST